MSLKSLSMDNLKSEDEFHTPLESKRGYPEHYLYNIFHKKCQTSFNSHKHEETRKSNVGPYMNLKFLHKKYPIIHDVCNQQ